jgi:hypothetical protein
MTARPPRTARSDKITSMCLRRKSANAALGDGACHEGPVGVEHRR